MRSLKNKDIELNDFNEKEFNDVVYDAQNENKELN